MIMTTVAALTWQHRPMAAYSSGIGAAAENIYLDTHSVNSAYDPV